MPEKPDFELAHVLFMDVVGYSRMLIDDQRDATDTLNAIVRATEQYRAAEAQGKLVSLPTGDGMALAFFGLPEAPARCSVEIARALREHPEIPLRMGINSGPVSRVADVNEKSNVAGGGINLAQRVMDCADAGHILLSRRVAEDLAQYREWSSSLHDLGECEVKHGTKVHVFNFFGDGFGNPATPQKLVCVESKPVATRPSRKWIPIGSGIVAALLLASLATFALYRKNSVATSAPSKPSPSSSTPEKSIAVLPFENRSEDKANAYFADGIQDEILTRLSKIADLKVISRTSTQHYKSTPENLPEIAKQLGVANILEGSVQKTGDQVRVNVQLINAANDSHLWAEIYDRKLTDILAVESEVAKTIAATLQAKLTGTEEQAIAERPTENLEAYDEYLRGLSIWTQITLSPLTAENAVRYFKRAVELDPKFGFAWARLSIAYSRVYFSPDQALPERERLAKDALDHAISLQPQAAETWLAKGYFYYWVRREFDKAAEALRQAVLRQPNNSDALVAGSYIARRQGKWDETVAQQIKVVEMDPRNPNYFTQLSVTYNVLRRFDEAHTALARALNITPDDPQLRAGLARLYLEEGNVAQAESAMRGVPPTPEFIYIFEIHVRLAWITQRYADAEKMVLDALAQEKLSRGLRGGQNSYLLGLSQQLAGREPDAKASYERSRVLLKEFLGTAPNNPDALMYLSLVEAMLHDKVAALRDARAAISARPASVDHTVGPASEETLARVEALVGDHDAALGDIERLLHTNYLGPEQFVLTPSILRLDPVWNPLRGDPRFEKLCRGSD